MKNIPLIIIAFFAFHLSLSAQVNHPLMNSHHFSTNASKYNPAFLGKDHNRTFINLIDAYGWVGTNFLSADLLKESVIDGLLDLSEVKIDELKSLNAASLGANVDILNFSTRIGKEKEIFTLKLGITSRNELSAIFLKDLASLVKDGNKQFEGQTIDVSPYANGFGALEFNLGGAFDLSFIHSSVVNVRAGVNVKTYMPYASVFTPKHDASLYTATGGEYLEAKYDMEVNTATVDDDNFNIGSGYGFDIGAEATILNRFFVGLSGVDIGRLSFDKNTTKNFSSDVVKYEGVDFDLFGDDDGFDEQKFDTLFNDFTEVEDESYTMPLPSKIILRAGYQTVAHTLNETKYHPHTVSLTYVQGFRNNGTASRRPHVVASYVYDLKRILNAGVNMGYGGANAYMLGGFLSVKGGPFRFGIGSSNMLGLVSSKATTMDIHTNLTFAFGK